MKQSKKVTHYVWSGQAAIHGVPARDLSVVEYSTHKKPIEETQKASGLTIYVPVEVENTEESEENN